MGQDLGQIIHFPGDGLSVIGEDLGLFAERALRALLTTAWVFIDKQIYIWAKVVKDNGSGRMERCVQPSRERDLRVPLFYWEIG